VGLEEILGIKGGSEWLANGKIGVLSGAASKMLRNKSNLMALLYPKDLRSEQPYVDFLFTVKRCDNEEFQSGKSRYLQKRQRKSMRMS